MMPLPTDPWDVLTPLISALLVFLIGAGGLRLNNRLRVDNRTVAEQARADEKIATLEKKVDRILANQRRIEDYAFDLRTEIAKLGGVPPDWPELDRD